MLILEPKPKHFTSEIQQCMHKYLGGFDTCSQFKEHWLKHIESIKREGRALDAWSNLEKMKKSKQITSYKLGPKPRRREGPKHGVEDSGRRQTWHEGLESHGLQSEMPPSITMYAIVQLYTSPKVGMCLKGDEPKEMNLHPHLNPSALWGEDTHCSLLCYCSHPGLVLAFFKRWSYFRPCTVSSTFTLSPNCCWILITQSRYKKDRRANAHSAMK